MSSDSGPPPDQVKPVPAPDPPRPADDPARPREKDEPAELGARMPVMQHLVELRSRLLKVALGYMAAFIGLYYPLQTKVLQFLLQPYLNAYNSLQLSGEQRVYTFRDVTTALSPQEVLFTDMKAIALVALMVSSPWVFYQLWRFVSPALYRREQLFVVPFILASTLFFLAGSAFCYYVILNISSAFLVLYAAPITEVKVSIDAYFGFALKLVLAFGLAFELPVAIFILARMGLVSAGLLWRKFRWAILVIAVVAAILTPPDVLSQTLLGVPLIVLYVLSIGVAHVFGKRKPAAPEQPDEPEQDQPTAAGGLAG